MPTVLRRGSYRIYFFSNEGNEPPHVHIDRELYTAKFWLNPVSYASSRDFSHREINKIMILLKNNSDVLLEEWREFFAKK